MRAPEFWHGSPAGLAATLLAPLGAAYGALGRWRGVGVTPWRAPVPVICVGNLTVGGAGKTPTVLALAERLQARGLAVASLSRGYGGRERGPLQVDPARHTAAEVGDEPLLLARVAAAWIARDRKDGARAAIAEGADVVLLDDGLQNLSLHKHLSLVVIDAGYGFGNGRLLPAGPLREPVARGLSRASAVVLIGNGEMPVAPSLPVLRARLVPDDAAHSLKGRRVVAFAGIGRPEKFAETLRGLSAELVSLTPFPDHHPYSDVEVSRLADDAQRADATLVTTEKDFVRVPEKLRPALTTVGVRLRFDEPEKLDALLEPVLRPSARPIVRP
jgi:tetraacyldisaccharide 4'-kinase